jgi:hypothetical protein
MSDSAQLAASQAAFEQLRRVTSVLALASRHQDDAGLQNLFDNLWLDGQPFRSRMTPGGLASSSSSGEHVPRGDRWANEIPALYCSRLTSQPVWPADEISELLELNVDMFREEFAAIDPDQYQVDARDHLSGLTDGRNWTVFPLYDGSGNLMVDNARKCPRIADFLDGRTGIGSIGCMAFFSIMNPKTHVPPHTSTSNIRVRYHLGIEVPERDVALADPRSADHLETRQVHQNRRLLRTRGLPAVRSPPGRVRLGRTASGPCSRGIPVSAGVHVVHDGRRSTAGLAHLP